ncbi:MAG: PilZ domain-containing protein [Candidatus Thiodiazotropha sp. L084R]
MSNTETKERRRFHRIIFDAPATIKASSGTYKTTLLDISLKGALAKIPDEWQPQVDEQVTLMIMLDDGESISMLTTCAHVEAGQLGLLCKEIDMISISLLRRLVELNVSDDILLQRDLEALG